MITEFSNPILSGFHPDPSICRVGNDYYLVTSSFDYFPGLPIFHSQDLINWQLVGHALTRFEQLPLQGCEPSQGIYAPTIRYHEGLFYIVCTNVSGTGNFIVTANEPAGPWSNLHILESAEGIDPSLFFDDDGRCWYVGNGAPAVAIYEGHRNLWLQELDTTSMTLIGSPKVIVDGGTDITKEPIWIEGPHIYKVDGRYILMAAEGGTGENHSVVVFHSDQIGGPYLPYELNPIVTHRNLPVSRKNPITCTGHGDLVQTQNGEWWMVLLGCRPYAPYENHFFNTGRETFLAPISWKDGWPVTADGSANVQRTYHVPNIEMQDCPKCYSGESRHMIDEFDQSTLHPRWIFARNPDTSAYSLEKCPGSLSIRPTTATVTSPGSPSMVLVRQRSTDYEAVTTVMFEPVVPGDCAGMCAIQNNTTYFAIEMIYRQDRNFLRLTKQETRSREALPLAVFSIPITVNCLRLRIKTSGANCIFSFADLDGDWTDIGGPQDATILSTRRGGGYVGAMIGLYSTSETPQSSFIARFKNFEYWGA